MPRAEERAACILVPETTYGFGSGDSPVRVCVIDLGTNSFHAIIADVHPNGSYQVVDRLKEMVRLGEHGLGANRLPPEAMERGLRALKRIKLLAEGWGAREYVSAATSAIREATNGGEFIRRAAEELNLRIRPITGEEEAHHIFQGVKRAVEFTEPSLLVDIGGGSVEFIVVVEDRNVFDVSLKIGAARMTERFVSTDPMSEADRAEVKKYLEAELERVVAACREYGVRRVVGSSGTMKSLARVTRQKFGDESRSIFQQALSVDSMRRALQWVVESTAIERNEHPGIEPKRVDQIGAGAVLLDTLLASLPSVEVVEISPNALREGMVVYFIETNYARLQQMASFRDPRRRSVHEIAYRFEWEENHAQHVAATATLLFNLCRPLYDGPVGDGELLEYSALLHDVGYLVNHAEHNEHSSYLIEHADLQGFQPEEIGIMALVARYHRNGFPEPTDDHFSRLSTGEKDRVRKLAGLLRVAEGLDRSHFQNVVALRARLSDAALHLSIATKEDPQLEVWAAEEEATLFESAFDRTLHVEPAQIPAETEAGSDSGLSSSAPA